MTVTARMELMPRTTTDRLEARAKVSRLRVKDPSLYDSSIIKLAMVEGLFLPLHPTHRNNSRAAAIMAHLEVQRGEDAAQEGLGE
jgi:hypothetical protein